MDPIPQTRTRIAEILVIGCLLKDLQGSYGQSATNEDLGLSQVPEVSSFRHWGKVFPQIGSVHI